MLLSSAFNDSGSSILPSWEDSFNYKPSSSSPIGSSKFKEALGKATAWLDQQEQKPSVSSSEEDRNKYLNQAQAQVSSALPASFDKLNDGTTIYTNPVASTVVIPGAPGTPGAGAGIGKLVGLVAGSLVGMPGLGATAGEGIGGLFG